MLVAVIVQIKECVRVMVGLINQAKTNELIAKHVHTRGFVLAKKCIMYQKTALRKYVMMERAKRMHIFITKVNKLFSFFVALVSNRIEKMCGSLRERECCPNKTRRTCFLFLFSFFRCHFFSVGLSVLRKQRTQVYRHATETKETNISNKRNIVKNPF